MSSSSHHDYSLMVHDEIPVLGVVLRSPLVRNMAPVTYLLNSKLSLLGVNNSITPVEKEKAILPLAGTRIKKSARARKLHIQTAIERVGDNENQNG